VLGPEVIVAVGQALDTLMPWLVASRFRILQNGNLEFSDAEPAEAIKQLRATADRFLPEDIRSKLGRRSGLGWNIFFGHVVGWWLPQRRHIGLLRALVDRAALHEVHLALRWNDGRPTPVVREKPGKDAMLWGGILGGGFGMLAMKVWRLDEIFVVLSLAAGVVGARVWQRVGTIRRCGDPLCHAPLGRAKQCLSCGGLCEDRR
jgi:hypothetical protein